MKKFILLIVGLLLNSNLFLFAQGVNNTPISDPGLANSPNTGEIGIANTTFAWALKESNIPNPPGSTSQRALVSVSFPTATTGYAAGTGGTIVKTTDGGETWSVVANPFQDILTGGVIPSFKAISFATEDLGYAVGDGGRVIKTTDGGNTWALSTPTTNYLWCVHAFGNTVIAAGYNGVLIKSTDAGVTWTSIQSSDIGTTGLNFIYFVNENLGFIAGQGSKIFKTVDGGNTWTLSNTGITGTTNFTSIFFTDANTGFVAGRRTSTIYKTTDGGATWTLSNTGAQANGYNRDLEGMAFNNNGIGVVVGSSGCAWTSTNSGLQWTYGKPEETNTYSINSVAFLTQNTAVAVGHYRKIYKLTITGANPPAPTLSVSPSTLNLANTANSTGEITVTSNQNWTVTSNAAWLTLSAGSGINNGNITVTATENTVTTARTAIVTFTAGTLTQTVSITQAAATPTPTLSVSPSTLNLANTANSTASILVTSNQNWTVTSNAAWLTLSTASGTNNGNITVTATENTVTTVRTAIVTFTAGSLTQTVSVTQDRAIPYLTAITDSFSIDENEQKIQVMIKSNTVWKVLSKADWITCSLKEGELSKTLEINISQNSTTKSREGKVIITYDKNKEKAIVFTQSKNTSNIEVLEGIEIFPNPFDEILHLKSIINIKNIQIIDACGKMCFNISNIESNTLNLSDLTSGTYTLLIEDIQGNKIIRKIVKQ